MLNVLELQKKLVSAAGPSGYESSCADVIAELAKPYADEIYKDTLGNLIVHKKGTGKKIMMPAHMDTIGFMATYIDKEGYVRFDGIGGHNPALLINTPVRFLKGVRGCIGYDKKSEINDKRISEIKMSNLFIDIGAENYEQAASMIKIGDVAVFEGEPRMILNGNMISPYCDDLISCAVLLLTMMQIKKTDNDLYFVFSTQEEVGCRGAKTAAHHIAPDMGIAVDVTGVGNCPETEKSNMAVYLGNGPAVKIKDSSVICNPQVVDHLRKAAEKAGIVYQDEILTAGGTDTSAMQSSRGGVLSGCISIGTKYIHSPVEMVNVKDVEQAAKLLAQAAIMEF